MRFRRLSCIINTHGKHVRGPSNHKVLKRLSPPKHAIGSPGSALQAHWSRIFFRKRLAWDLESFVSKPSLLTLG